MGIIRSLLVGLGVAVGAGAGAVAAFPAVAGASGQTVNFGNNTEITVPAGWTVGQVKGNKLAITKSSPHAVIEVASGTSPTGTVAALDSANFNGFVSGFGLKHVKVLGRQTTKTPSGTKFTSAASISYRGTFEGKKLSGLSVEYLNTTTRDVAFAIVITQTSDKSTLETPVDNMFGSIATNP